MDHFAITLGRTFAGFFVLLILTRLIGKKQLSQITMFNYITGIALGNIAGDMVVHRDINLADGIMGLVLWTLLAIGIEYLALKSSKTRILLDGEPTILIKDGRLIEKSLISNRLNIDDLTMLLRDKGIFSIQEADYAILEPNGKLSILKKMEYENTVKSDFHLHKKRKFLPAELIADGKLVKKNLEEAAVSEEWLRNKLREKGAAGYDEVLYAELQEDGSLYVQKKSEAD